MLQKIWDSFWIEHYGFKSFSTEHFFIVFLTILSGFLLIKHGQQQTTEAAKVRIGMRIAWVIWASEAFWLFHKWQTNSFGYSNLPFDLCNVLVLTIPIAMSRRSSLVFQAYYFLIMTGTLQGVLTPDLKSAFPYIGYIKFWLVHSGLVIAVLYGVFVYRIYPTFKGLLWAFIAINAYALCVYPINLLLNTNFGYIMHKPEGGSILDLLGNNYVLKLEPIVLTFFLIFWLPFAFRKKEIV